MVSDATRNRQAPGANAWPLLALREILNSSGEKGREVQLKLVGGTLKKRFALEKVRDLLK